MPALTSRARAAWGGWGEKRGPRVPAWSIRVGGPIDVERDAVGVEAFELAAGDGAAIVTVGIGRADGVAVADHDVGQRGERGSGGPGNADAVGAEGDRDHFGFFALIGAPQVAQVGGGSGHGILVDCPADFTAARSEGDKSGRRGPNCKESGIARGTAPA